MPLHHINLKSKTAIITGGGGGIGLAISKALVDAGASIAIVGRDQSKLESAANELRKGDGEVITVQADMIKVNEIKNMVEKVEESFGRIDILVNNAGLNIPKMAVDVTEEDWDSVQNVNLKGLFFCSQEVGKRMIKQGGGKIVNIASQMGVVGLHKRAAYCSAKGGVVQLTKVLAIEWAPYSINVNAIGPTFIESPMLEEVFKGDEAFKQDALSRIPMGKPGKMKDVSGAVLYLSSDLSNFVTGHTLLVDGGYVAW